MALKEKSNQSILMFDLFLRVAEIGFDIAVELQLI